MEDELFRGTTAGFSRLFSLNLFSKLITFGFNTAIIRLVHPDAKGLERTFEAVVNMALFLQREAVRNAAQRQKPFNREMLEDPKQKFAQLITLGWLMVPWGLLCTIMVCVLHQYNTSGGQYESLGSLRGPLMLYAVSIIMEVMAEPSYLLAQNLLLFDLRVVIEGLALLAKTLFTWFSLRVWTHGSTDIISTLHTFGYAQCIHSAVIFVGYNVYFIKNRHKSPELKTLIDSPLKLLPHRVRACSWIDFEQFRATMDMWVESFLRCVLQEGEKWVMMNYILLAEQGAYDVVANLGSLVARMLFKFIEDIAFTTWSKLLGDERPTPKALQKSGRFFSVLLTFLLVVGIIFVVFGIPFSKTLLFLLYSDRWLKTSAPALLMWYCVYVALMGLSGVSEAFIRSAASTVQFNSFKMFQLLCGIMYLGCLYLFAERWQYGSVGVIMANIISMTARFVYCFGFAIRYFRDHNGAQYFSLKGVLSLRSSTWIVTLLSAIILYTSYSLFPLLVDDKVSYRNLLSHLGLGVPVFLVFVAVFYKGNGAFLMDLKRLWKSENIE